MSTASGVRKALRGLEEGLSVFTTQLAQETAELRRNVENQPTTGPTFYARILEDLASRLEGVGEELQALEAVSLDAISLEELVGHSVALYCQNHQHIQQLEARLAQYGYLDLFSPLPPESPLDMLELAPAGQTGGGHAAGGRHADGYPHSEAALSQHPEGYAADADEGSAPEALCEVTNQLAAAHLAAECEASPPPAQQLLQQRAAALPRTTLKALAPMTAAKALMRADTPSSIASPEALSPSMRELLGKYAASSSGGGTRQQPLTAAPSTSATPQPPGSAARATPPVPSYLSPAFQLAAMEQQVQMAHTEAAAAGQQLGGTPGGPAGGWQADEAMMSALTATAAKLAGKPGLMEAYRQRFPALLASTERLLQTVEKQGRPAAAAAGDAEAAEVAGAMQAPQHAQQAHVDEESTLELMSVVLAGRRGGQAGAQHSTEDMRGAAAAAGSTHFHRPAAAAHSPTPLEAAAGAEEQLGYPPPSTAALLSRAVGASRSSVQDGTGSASFGHPISSLRASNLQLPAAQQQQQQQPPLAAPMQSAPRSEHSKPQLEEAIAAALGRSTAVAPTPAASTRDTQAGGSSATEAWVPSTRAAPAPVVPGQPEAAWQLALPPSAVRALVPPAAPAASVSVPTQPVQVPPLRLVAAEEYAALPTFIKSQLPLEALNSTLAAVHAAARERSSGFSMADVEAAGLGAKSKVVVNSLVKLGRAQLKVLPNHGGTLYLLV